VTKAIPHVIVRINGALQSKAPEQVSQGPRLVIRLNGVIQNVVPLPRRDGVSQESDNFNGVDSEDVELDSDAEDGEKHDSDGEEGELVSRVDRFYKININEKDSKDGPDWMFNEDETTSKDPEYVFCPAPHRKQILHLFTKHFCQHPLFAEKDGKWTKEQICNNAVYEMYSFCCNCGL